MAGATDFGYKLPAKGIEYPATVDRITVQVRYRLLKKDKSLLFVKSMDQKRVIEFSQRLVLPGSPPNGP